MAKTLVLYYSRSGENHYAGGLKHLEVGNTQIAAQFIADQVGADLFRVDTVTPYPESYKECCGQAVAEWKGNARPAVQAIPENIARYDAIVVGYPIWCGTMPMCLYTVLEQLELSGKRVYALATHEGSGFAGSVGDLKKLCPNSDVQEALAVKGCQVKDSEELIRAWAKEHLNP